MRHWDAPLLTRWGSWWWIVRWGLSWRRIPKRLPVLLAWRIAYDGLPTQDHVDGLSLYQYPPHLKI